MKYRLGIFLTVCMLVISGCGLAKEPEEVKEKREKIQIGMAIDSKILERWERDVDIYVREATRMGAEVEVVSANADVQVQIQQIEQFIKQEKDVITVVAVDCDRLKLPLEKAKKAGIKVISYDRLITNVDSDLYISFDNARVGELMAETMLNELPDGGQIMMICGPKSDNNAIVIEEAFKEKMKESNLEIVRIDYAEGWTPEYASLIVDKAFEDVDDIDGVMCGNDALAVHAISALSERQIAGEVCVVGQDADVEACQKIVEGTQTMTVYKPIEELAKKAAEYSVMLAQDLPLNEVTETVRTGEYQVKAKLIEPVAVTKVNMDEIIVGSGFHKRDDVYLTMQP